MRRERCRVPVPLDPGRRGDESGAEADEHAGNDHSEHDQIEDKVAAAKISPERLRRHDAEDGRGDHRHEGQGQRAHERNADRQWRDARRRGEAEDVLVPEERPFLDRELRAALRAFLEGQDAEHDERPVEEQQEQTHIDGENGLEEPGPHGAQSSFFRSTMRRRPAITIAMMRVRMTPTTEASAHLSEPTCGHDDVAEQIDLAARERGARRELAEHHDADEDRADDDAGQTEREDDLAQHTPEIGAEIARGFEDVRVYAAEHEGDRPDHEDDVDLRHADHDREIGEQQRVDRLVNDPRLHEQDVDRSFLAEHRAPGENADQERGPERDDAQDEAGSSGRSCSSRTGRRTRRSDSRPRRS